MCWRPADFPCGFNDADVEAVEGHYATGVVDILPVQTEVITVKSRVELAWTGIVGGTASDEPDEVVQRIADQGISPIDQARHGPGARVDIDLAVTEVGMKQGGRSGIERWCEVIAQHAGAFDELFGDGIVTG